MLTPSTVGLSGTQYTSESNNNLQHASASLRSARFVMLVLSAVDLSEGRYAIERAEFRTQHLGKLAATICSYCRHRYTQTLAVPVREQSFDCSISVVRLQRCARTIDFSILGIILR
jgi:hypothetical protein